MVVAKELRDSMDMLDTHAESIGSGIYNQLALALKAAADSVSASEDKARFDMAIDLVSELPANVNSTRCHIYTHSKEFMKATVRNKAIELKEVIDPTTAGIMADIWMCEMVDAFLDDVAGKHPEAYPKIRYGIVSLLLAQTGMLPKILERLEELNLTSDILCPTCKGMDADPEDTGDGPDAATFLAYEPRMLRWVLGKSESSPWPVALPSSQPVWMCNLIDLANKCGGDDATINQACRCKKCKEFRLPVFRPRTKKRLREEALWPLPLGLEGSGNELDADPLGSAPLGEENPARFDGFGQCNANSRDVAVFN